MAARRFGGLAGGIGKIGDVTLDTAQKVNVKRIADVIDDVGGDFAKIDYAKIIRKGDQGLDDLASFGALLKKAELDGVSKLDKVARKSLLKNASDLVTASGKLPRATGATVAESAKAMDGATSFFKRYEKQFLLAGVTAAGLAALMLLTGESDPGKAIGGAIGDLAEGVGEGVGAGLGAGLGGAAKGISDGLGVGDFFSSWGMYIGIFCAVLLILGLFMMLK
jgi:hypothetical protein